MADQLLSQADVDALVASLTKNEPAKPAVSAPAPPKPASTGAAPRPASAAPNRPPAVSSTPASAKPAVVNSVPSPAPKVQPQVKAESKPEVSGEVVNNLNAKIADLTKQINQMGASLKRMEELEKKIARLEAENNKPKESPVTDRKIQQLSEDLKKMAVNLKGTPGYGIKNTFKCAKCDDTGHVAVMFRCTHCGQEKWYGWWPNK